ncbi:MAG TPA: hypothetical protein PLA18_01420 [Deltaproteobacteria bacterium]|nr:hypothetical protein [Deltaproteobacteria bacterium]
MNSKTVLWIAVLLLGCSFLFAGCAGMKKKEAARTGDILSAAGFTTKTPDSPEAWNKFNSMKPLKMMRTEKDGEIIYVYPDPYNCNCVYVGNEKQYQDYKRLALQKQIAEANLQAAQMWETGDFGPYDGCCWW